MIIGTTLGTRTHEKVGEKFLRNLGFPDSVTLFVRGHVDAKRYLVYRYDKTCSLNLKSLTLSLNYKSVVK